MSPLTKTCEVCGNDFPTKKSHFESRRTCSKACYAIIQASENKGSGNNNFRGAKASLQCLICGKIVEFYPSASPNRKFCSQKCASIHKSMYFVGAVNSQWTGGREKYYGPDWNIQSERARQRDQHTCRDCGATEHQIGRRLDVHHLKPFRLFLSTQDANKLDNLISLCRICHQKKEAEARLEYALPSLHPKPYPEPGSYSPRDAARILGLTTWAIYSMIKRGKLVPTNIWENDSLRSRSRYVISQDDLDRLIRERSE